MNYNLYFYNYLILYFNYEIVKLKIIKYKK